MYNTVYNNTMTILFYAFIYILYAVVALYHLFICDKRKHILL